MLPRNHVEAARAQANLLRWAIAQTTETKRDCTLAAWAADEIERLRADNERLTDKLAKIAEQENYK